MDESEEIVAYVQRKGNGVSWTELTKEFENKRGWSHGKFVNHLGEAKVRLEKRLTPEGQGRPRYFAKNDEETRKIALKKDIADLSFTEATIPMEIIEKGLREFEERLSDHATRSAGLLTSIELAKGEMRFFKEREVGERIVRYRDAFKIDLIYPKGALPPKIPGWSYWQLLQITRASSATDSKLTNFRIVLSYDLAGVKEHKKFDEESFVEWLKKFKHKNITTEMRGYLRDKKKPNEKSVPVYNLEEYAQCREYQLEFMKKYNSYLKIATDLAQKAAQ